MQQSIVRLMVDLWGIKIIRKLPLSIQLPLIMMFKVVGYIELTELFGTVLMVYILYYKKVFNDFPTT